MAPRRFVNSDLPPEALDYFELVDGVVRWTANPVTRANGPFRRRRAPWGEAAGSRLITGHGGLITFAGCSLLVGDVAFALANGGEWPWQVSGARAWIADTSDERGAALARERWRIDGDTLVWRVNRGWVADGSPAYPAGSPVRGFDLSGFAGNMVSSSGFGFLAADVRHLLAHGVWPWEADNWD